MQYQQIPTYGSQVDNSVDINNTSRDSIYNRSHAVNNINWVHIKNEQDYILININKNII